MPVNISESNFETIIERVLVQQNGYLKRIPADYDREFCMDVELVVKFIQATQPSTWIRYVKQYPTEAAWRFTQRLAQQIERQGTLYTLHHEFKDSGCHFRLLFLWLGYRALKFRRLRTMHYTRLANSRQKRYSLG